MCADARSQSVKDLRRISAFLFWAAVTAGCASNVSGPDGCHGQTLKSESGTTLICTGPDIGLAGYGKAMLGVVRIEASPVASSTSAMVPRPAGARYPLGPQQKKALEAEVAEAFESALATLELDGVESGGTGVLLARGQILDVLFEAPEDPDSGARYLLDTVARGTLIVELRDSQSGSLLMRASGDRSTSAGGADDQSQSAQLEQLAALWGEMLVESVRYLRNDEDG